jgi:hypothetical protein
MIAKLQEAVLRIMPLAAVRALQIATPSGALVVVILGNNKAGAATARDEKHSYRSCRDLSRLAAGHQLTFFHCGHGALFPLICLQDFLPQAQRIRCDFYKFVVRNELDCLL